MQISCSNRHFLKKTWQKHHGKTNFMGFYTSKEKLEMPLCDRNPPKRNNVPILRCVKICMWSLSKYIWNLKDNNIPYSLSWKIIARSKAFSPNSKKCALCILEKYYIICKPEICTLNDRNELGSDCKHRRKHLLERVKWIPQCKPQAPNTCVHYVCQYHYHVISAIIP